MSAGADKQPEDKQPEGEKRGRRSVGKPELRVRIGELELKNPVLTASGTFGFGEDYRAFFDPEELGGLALKGLTIEARRGNPAPRIAETPAGMLNAIGLQNPGIEEFITDCYPPIAELNTPIIANISGESVSEYAELAARLDRLSGIHALEINISCPNVSRGGLAFGSDPDSVARVVGEVRSVTEKTLITKLSPNVTDIVEMAQAAAEAGTDAVSLINTLLGMKVDTEQGEAVLASRVGGLSGPAVRPVAVRMVYEVARNLDRPVIGMGGIVSTEDALEFIMAGAVAVAVGTGSFVQPRAAVDIIQGLEGYLRRKGYSSIREITGIIQEPAE